MDLHAILHLLAAMQAHGASLTSCCQKKAAANLLKDKGFWLNWQHLNCHCAEISVNFRCWGKRNQVDQLSELIKNGGKKDPLITTFLLYFIKPEKSNFQTIQNLIDAHMTRQQSTASGEAQRREL
jgi:hypothetical protein